MADAIDSVMPAFELVDDRNVKWAESAPHLLSGIADNIWNTGIILGAPVTDWRSLDLAEARGTMSINGKVVGEGQGKEVMGHPLEALTWLANMLAKRGASLGEGMVVVTGRLLSLHLSVPGDYRRGSGGRSWESSNEGCVARHFRSVCNPCSFDMFFCLFNKTVHIQPNYFQT